jgi:transcriptional regulator with XRE-family HTH domain
VTLFRWTEILNLRRVTGVPRRSATPALIRAIGQALRDERERRGWSQEELSDRAGLDRTYLSGVERGQRSPNLRNLIRLTEALAIPLSRVLLAAEAKPLHAR